MSPRHLFVVLFASVVGVGCGGDDADATSDDEGGADVGIDGSLHLTDGAARADGASDATRDAADDSTTGDADAGAPIDANTGDASDANVNDASDANDARDANASDANASDASTNDGAASDGAIDASSASCITSASIETALAAIPSLYLSIPTFGDSSGLGSWSACATGSTPVDADASTPICVEQTTPPAFASVTSQQTAKKIDVQATASTQLRVADVPVQTTTLPSCSSVVTLAVDGNGACPGGTSFSLPLAMAVTIDTGEVPFPGATFTVTSLTLDQVFDSTAVHQAISNQMHSCGTACAAYPVTTIETSVIQTLVANLQSNLASQATSLLCVPAAQGCPPGATAGAGGVCRYSDASCVPLPSVFRSCADGG